MIDEAKARSENEKIVELVDLALDIDVDYLREIRPDAEFLAVTLDGWIADMMQTALRSMDAFFEYREKLDAIVSEMGLDMFVTRLKGEHGDA